MSVSEFIAARATRPEPKEKEGTEDAAEGKQFDRVVEAIDGLGETVTGWLEDHGKRMGDALDEAARKIEQAIPAIGQAIVDRERQQDAQMKMMCDEICAMRAENTEGLKAVVGGLKRIEDCLMHMMSMKEPM